MLDAFSHNGGQGCVLQASSSGTGLAAESHFLSGTSSSVWRSTQRMSLNWEPAGGQRSSVYLHLPTRRGRHRTVRFNSIIFKYCYGDSAFYNKKKSLGALTEAETQSLTPPPPPPHSKTAESRLGKGGEEAVDRTEKKRERKKYANVANTIQLRQVVIKEGTA